MDSTDLILDSTEDLIEGLTKNIDEFSPAALSEQHRVSLNRDRATPLARYLQRLLTTKCAAASGAAEKWDHESPATRRGNAGEPMDKNQGRVGMTILNQKIGRPLHVIEFKQSSVPHSAACDSCTVRRHVYRAFDCGARQCSSLGGSG
jgi:hypothetical protein